MITPFGKDLRKLRIDRDETLFNMAKKLEVSISYLSSIESGHRNIPDNMVENVIKKYRLNKVKAESLREAAANSSGVLDINLIDITPQQRKLVFALSRKINGLTDDECADMLRRLQMK